MATELTYNGFNLQTDTYRTGNITYRHLAEKRLDTKPDFRRGGFSVVDTLYSQKVIGASGWIKVASESDLFAAIRDLKKALKPQEKWLVVSTGATVQRFKATCQLLDVPEEFWHITDLPYRMEFLCLPWATKTSSITDTKSITSSPYSNSIDVGGSFGPFPVLKWKVSGTPNAAITKIKFENTTTEDWLEVDGLTLDADGKFLEVDCEKMTVKEGTTIKDFTGVFPSFEPGSNSYEVTITGGGTAFTLDQTITYFETFL